MTIVLVTCGRRKRATATIAGELYVGGLTGQGVKWARSVTDTAHIYIVSALYGLVPHDRVIEPYNVTLGDLHAITPGMLQEQARNFGILHRPVVMVSGQAYARLIRSVWQAPVVVPFGVEGGHRQWFEMMDAMRAMSGKVPA